MKKLDAKIWDFSRGLDGKSGTELRFKFDLWLLVQQHIPYTAVIIFQTLCVRVGCGCYVVCRLRVSVIEYVENVQLLTWLLRLPVPHQSIPPYINWVLPGFKFLPVDRCTSLNNYFFIVNNIFTSVRNFSIYVEN